MGKRTNQLMLEEDKDIFLNTETQKFSLTDYKWYINAQ